MEVISDTSFLMVLCYDPVKNLDALESRFGKLVWLIHPETINELLQLEKTAGPKRSKIASLSLKIINDQLKKGDFKYLDNNELDKLELPQQFNSAVDSILLNISAEKKRPLATIDKNLIKRALKKGVDVITLKSNRIIFVNSKVRSNLNYS
jgi:rRNA-processing protein FCF1